MSTQSTQPSATPQPTIIPRRRLRAIAGTLALVLALCGLSAAGATAAAAESPVPSAASSPRVGAASIRSGSPTKREYWCVPDLARPGSSSRVGRNDEASTDDDADDGQGADLTELVDLVDLVDDERGGRDRRDRDSTIWLEGGHGRQWPFDLGSLGVRVRIGTLTADTQYATGPSKQLTHSRPGKLRCRVTPSAQTRTDRDNHRWACVLTDRDRDTPLPRPRGSSLDRPTNRTGGPIIIMRDTQRASDRDWSDEQLWPGDQDWWPHTLPGEHPRLLMPSSGRSTSSTPAAGNRRCLVMYSGEDGVEVHLGQLSTVAPPQ